MALQLDVFYFIYNDKAEGISWWIIGALWQLVINIEEPNLAKVEVASSNLVSRSII